MKKIWALGFLLLTLGRNPSAQALDLSVLATLNFASPSVQTAGNVQATATNAGFGVGALVAFPFLGGLNLETGLLYVTHCYNSGGFRTNISGLQVPALLRFTGLPVLSIAAGPYISFPTGSLTTTNISNNNVTTVAASSSHLSRMDFGLAFSAAADFALSPSLSFVADLRYYFALVNTDSTVPNSFKYGGLLILGGLKMGL